MRYTEADCLATSLTRHLVVCHQTKYPGDDRGQAESYALGYLTSLLATMACNSEEVAQRLEDALESTVLYTKSLG